MQELIKVTITQGGKQVVSAREFFDYLDLDKNQWSRWYTKNIVKNALCRENEDWVSSTDMSKSPEMGRPTQDFAITLDFAKRLAMMSRTEKGEQARQYFLEMERKAQNPLKNITRLDMAKMLLEAETENVLLAERVEAQKKELQIAAPKVQYYNEVLASDSLIPTTVIAKELGLSAVALNKLLHTKKVIYKVGDTWVPYQQYQNMGYTKPKTTVYTTNTGEAKTVIHTYWTESGRSFIHSLIK
jgi:anti-repressor protein